MKTWRPIVISRFVVETYLNSPQKTQTWSMTRTFQPGCLQRVGMEELEELRLSCLRLGRNQQPSQGSRVSGAFCDSEPQPSPGTTFHGERDVCLRVC